MKKSLKSIMLIGSLVMAAAIPVLATPVDNGPVAIVEVEQNQEIQRSVPRSITYEVVGTGVRLRLKPGTSSSVVATLTNGEWLTGQGEDPVFKDGYEWISVVRQSTGEAGYVARDYLEER